MNEMYPPTAIAEMLAEVWKLHKEDGFLNYITIVCGCSTPDPPIFNRIYIAQAEDGDIRKDILVSTLKWWQVDDLGLRETPRPPLSNDPYVPTERLDSDGFYYIAPMMRFFNQGDEILIEEIYGPHIFARKMARLVWQDNGLRLTAVRIITTYDSLMDLL